MNKKVRKGPNLLETREIENLAEQILESHEALVLPVDPLTIARLEQIALVPGQYSGAFDGRIEYRKAGEGGRFCLFYADEEPPWRPLGRVRFSVAHELGHFYISTHRKFLLSGRWHGSRADFISDKPTEREADQFAAALLMPRRLFHKQVARKSQKVCSLQELLRLSSDVFITSVTSTAIRYCELDYEPCCIVVSEAGEVRYCIASADMREFGLGWVRKGDRVPANSVTARLLTMPPDSGRLSHPLEGPVESEVWFDSRHHQRLWEETVLLGRTGRALTLLSAEPSVEDDDC